mmetsp:Transcript_12842/g.32859  ORF Transcript_12842/g.32859 Transcript_12842/m.32859 type:complete len:309 (+) Transcript_12842:125-1051(+)
MGAAPKIEPLGITVASVLNARNHFEVIGLEPKKCCGTELRRAYKMTALKVHPDKCQDARAIEAFRRLQEAFKVLSDPMLHARYAQTLASAQSRAAASRANARSAAYSQRAKMTKEELERQVREMMARQSKQRPMATGEAARKAAEERVAKERERQQRLEKEEKARQAEAIRRREEAEKALNSARNRTPRTPKTRPPAEVPLDPEAQKAAEERAARRAASMGFLSDQMGWARATRRESSQSSSRQSSSRSPRSSRPTSARSPRVASPFGDLRSMRRAQTERALKRPVPPASYLPRFMREKAMRETVIKV